ncbi:unnamed protein product [Gordionus sp. m RMFG-2023]|uniref:uncharacterized protein LOC135930816 n=1 Tax=Gordionus sp. m RMFG-2023 TaxID=3053472 RepID=UPI0030E588AA
MDKFCDNLNINPCTSEIKNFKTLDNKVPKTKYNKTFVYETTHLYSKQNTTLEDDDYIAYAKYGAKFWDQPTYIVSNTPDSPPLIFKAPKMELFLKAKKFYDMAAPIFKICDLEHEENQKIFTSFYIYYSQLLESLRI